MQNRPRIIITTGDPKGIGPEVTEKALKDRRIQRLADFNVIDPGDDTGFGAIKKAAGILKKRKADGLVTSPVNKAVINRSGIPFKGHTEFLAEITDTKNFAMMFCDGSLRVTLVTRHVPLKSVSGILTQANIEDAITLTDSALRDYFTISMPKIGVCGLNPHCGEDGLLGTEESRIIIPAIERLRPQIPRLMGPLPADIIFYMAYKKKFHAVVAMYHDQGLAPFKMLAFENGVNVTIGLPFVRTSPNHGTAYNIAGKGIANPNSMKEAIRLAVSMCRIKTSSKIEH